MPHPVLQGLTSLGDSAITLPIAAVILVWLAIWGDRRTILVWIAALLACGAVTAALKIYFKACPLPGLGLDSPSGHTSMSLFVYGGLTLMTASQLRRWPRVGVALAGAAFIVAIAITRVMLDYHSRSEVVIGSIVGALALGGFAAIFRRRRETKMPLWPLWLAALVPILLLGGRSVSAEGLLGRIALHLRNVIDFCV